MNEILLDNKNGNVWDISRMAPEITWKTSRIGKAGSLEFTMIKGAFDQDKSFQYNNGDILRFRSNNKNVFFGRVFKIGSGKDETVKITAYDQLRSFMYHETYIATNVTATEVIKKHAADLELKIGTLAETGYRIPTMAEDNKKRMDIICKALDQTLIATTKNFVLYDDFGQLTLKNINDMAVDIIIGDESLMTDYSFDRSIDDDTYNRIKVYQDNKQSGKRDVYIVQDSANIAKWGQLQLLHKADENMNPAQINNLLNQLIAVKNREQKKIRITAIGDLKIRAGCFVPIIINELKLNQYFLVDECTHRWEGADHTMVLDLKVI